MNTRTQTRRTRSTLSAVGAATAVSAALLLSACGPQDGQAVAGTAPQAVAGTTAPAATAAPKVVTKTVYVKQVEPKSDSVAQSSRVGEVSSIEPITERPQGSGTGAVVGGVLGAVLGNQIGKGDGRTAATAIGAVGGAVAGNNVERNNSKIVVGYRVKVRLDNGQARTFEEKRLGGLQVGDRVRIEAGQLRRA